LCLVAKDTGIMLVLRLGQRNADLVYVTSSERVFDLKKGRRQDYVTWG